MNVTLYRNRLKVENYSTEEKKKLKKLYGANDNKTYISLPLEPLIIQYFAKYFQNVNLCSKLQKWYSDFREDLKIGLSIKKFDGNGIGIPLEVDLKDYQKVGIEFIKHAKRVLLADDRGLGKTLTCLAFCESIDVRKVLIVSPGYLKKNIQRELVKWFGLSGVLCAGEKNERKKQLQENAKYTIVNYEMLRKTTKIAYPEILNTKWDVVIFDEAHRLQNPKSQFSVGAKAIQAEYMIQCTGTPVADTPDQIWHLLHLLYPKRFSAKWAFIEYFCDVEKTFWGQEIKGINERTKRELQWILQPIMIRRLKQGLPEKLHKEIYILLEGEHLKSYLAAKRFLYTSNGELKVIESKIEQIVRFQQIVANPAILGGSNISLVEQTVTELVKDIGSQRIIVGLVYKMAASFLKQTLEKAFKRPVFIITGDTKDRDLVVENFKQTKDSILIGTITAMAEGLSIDECDHMIFADASWDPRTNDQFEDRIHRMTSTRNKHYYHIIVGDTISEAKWEKLLDKQTKSRNLLDDKAVVKYLYENI
jgi:SNF2 family DNA or RNA helicase